MSQSTDPTDPTKPWADRLGKYQWLPKKRAVRFADGSEEPWASVLQWLTEGATAGAGTAKDVRQPTSQSSQAGITRQTYAAAGQQATIDTGEAAQLTPPDLLNASIFAHRRIVETRSTGGSTNSKYRVQRHPEDAFKAANVIELLYPDNAGGDSAITPTGQYTGEMRVRRFVIIEHRVGCSAALPILTYNGQGVAKPGVVKQHHVIIYTGPSPPVPTEQEGPARMPNDDLDTLRPHPLQVIPEHAGTRLDDMSRLNLREHFVIDHHVEVHIFGALSPASAQTLHYSFRAVNQTQRQTTTSERPIAGPSTNTGSSRPSQVQRPNPRGAVNENDDDDEEEEDREVVSLALRVRALGNTPQARLALSNLQSHDERTGQDLYPRVIAYLRRTAQGGGASR